MSSYKLYDKVVGLTLISRYYTQELAGDQYYDAKLHQAEAAGEKSFYAYVGTGAERKLKKFNTATSFYGEVGYRSTRTGGGTKVINIPMLHNGYKPNISVSLSMLPSGISYNIHVEVANAVLLKGLDIREFVAFTVKLGYTGGEHDEKKFITQSFTGPIMASYVTGPQPDAHYVFDGVAIGYTGADMMKLRPYKVKFNSSTHSIQEIFTSVADQLGIAYDYSKCSEKVLKTELQFSSETVQAENAYSIINWMGSVFSAFSKGVSFDEETTYDADSVAKEQGTSVFVRYQNDKLTLVSTDYVPKDKELKTCTSLNHIKSANFTGPVLNVSAPYNPLLQPGDIFYLNPIYYNGGTQFINAIEMRDANPSNGCYTIIKMDVNFSSVAGTNDMNIMAIGVAHYLSKDVNYNDFIRRVTDDQQSQIKASEKAQMQPQTITIGLPDPAEEADIPDRSLWSVPDPGFNYSTIAMTQPAYQYCTTFQSVAHVAWGDDLFYVDDQHMSQQYERNFPKGVPVWYLYPLIQVCTYKNANAKTTELAGNTYSEMQQMIDANAPDAVGEHWTIYLPGGVDSSVDDLKQMLLGNSNAAEIMLRAGLYRKKVGDFSGMFYMQDLYNYIKFGRV